MKRILKNGIYEGSDGAASTSYYRLTELNKDGYTEETLAVITMDGVFQMRDSSPAEYARIVAFGQDGYRAEPVNNYDSSRHERVRYYFYSKETIAQWLE